MKKIILLALSIILTAGAAGARTFGKGDIVADVNLGGGMAKTTTTSYVVLASGETFYLTEDANKGLFTQRLGVEYCVAEIGRKVSLGLGLSFISGQGSTNMADVGVFDYEYKMVTADWSGHKTTTYVQRKGSGTALAKTDIVDFTTMLRVAFHFEATDNLDLYAGTGFGVSRLDNVVREHDFMEGFDSETVNLTEKYYSYDDLENVKWIGTPALARFAAAFYVGARVYVSKHIALQFEAGLPCMSFQRDYNHYNFANFGVAYKF